jgi:hypothetical protein
MINFGLETAVARTICVYIVPSRNGDMKDTSVSPRHDLQGATQKSPKLECCVKNSCSKVVHC